MLITVIEPSGTRHHIAVAQSPRDWAPVPGMMGHAKLTWGESGLFAISSSYPFVTNDDRHAPFGAWTMVVDDRGQRVGTFGGWQGLAWSPDGLGLLGGHKVSNQDNDQRYVLEVRYGPGLRHRRRVGIAPLPIDVSAWR